MNLEKVWPQWKVEKVIGKGSYGTVYKCFSEEGGKKEYSAIKVISVPSDDAELAFANTEGMSEEQTKIYFKDIADGFLSEVKILETLKGCENIISIYDSAIVEKSGSIGWDIYIRMELLTDFAAYISDKKLGEEEVIKLGLDVCNALAVCGKQKILHRDIKP